MHILQEAGGAMMDEKSLHMGCITYTAQKSEITVLDKPLKVYEAERQGGGATRHFSYERRPKAPCLTEAQTE